MSQGPDLEGRGNEHKTPTRILEDGLLKKAKGLPGADTRACGRQDGGFLKYSGGDRGVGDLAGWTTDDQISNGNLEVGTWGADGRRRSRPKELLCGQGADQRGVWPRRRPFFLSESVKTASVDK